MKKILTSIFFLFFITSVSNTNLYAQKSGFDDVRLFQSYFQDARITGTPYVNGNFFFGDFDFVDFTRLNARGGYTFTPEIEAEGSFGFVNANPRFGNSESGVSDLFLTGRYLFDIEEISIAAGTFFTLPIGTESAGEENFNFGFYGAVRHVVSEKVALTGNLQFNIIEMGFDDDRELSVGVGLGSIVNVAERVNVVGELLIESETDYAAISGGADYKLRDIGHIRGGLIVGIDDGAPDIGVTAGFLFPFN
ncbi:MAG TPA: hypothetical protein VKM36_01250 [Balneolaceae bacterium]|nr:hypothetical protein [Balneolaceae bacterium]